MAQLPCPATTRWSWGVLAESDDDGLILQREDRGMRFLRPGRQIGNRSPLLPLGDRLLVHPIPLRQRSQALLTMLYRSTDCLSRGGAPVKNLSHSASLQAGDNNAPSKSGIKHLMLMLRRFKSHLPPQGHSPRSRPQRSNSALTATFVPTANPAHPRSFRPYFIAIPATSSLNACFSVSTQLHLDDDQMRDLMRQIVNRLYTFHTVSYTHLTLPTSDLV